MRSFHRDPIFSPPTGVQAVLRFGRGPKFPGCFAPVAVLHGAVGFDAHGVAQAGVPGELLHALGETLGVEGVGCFPNMRRPRTVWAGVGTGAADLVALHDALEPPLLDLGCYRREERQYAPHLTLGRVKGDGSTDRLTQALLKQAAWRGGECEVDAVRVMSSELRPDGPVYSVLSTVKLRTPARRAPDAE